MRPFTISAAPTYRPPSTTSQAVVRAGWTVCRSVHRLCVTELVGKEPINSVQGGSSHVSRALDDGEIAVDMVGVLDGWYAKLDRLIAEFEAKYETSAALSVED